MIAFQQQEHSSIGVIFMFVPHVHDTVRSEELQEHIHLQDVDSSNDAGSSFLSPKGNCSLYKVSSDL